MSAVTLSSTVLVSSAVGFSCGLAVGWFLHLRRARRVWNAGPPKASRYTKVLAENFADNVSGECKLVLVVRNDLKMGKGKVAAQCCHAAVMAYQQLHDSYPDLLEEWKGQGQAKVVLKIDDETSLLELAENARNAGLVVSLVRDAGRTQIAPGSRTVLGVGPGPKELVDMVTGHLKLF